MELNENIPIISAGVDVYSNSNLFILKQNIENALREGFKATYLSDPSDFDDIMADNFAKAAAGPIADAVNNYIKGMIKSQNITITPTLLTGITPAGSIPVSGVISTLTDIKIL